MSIDPIIKEVKSQIEMGAFMAKSALDLNTRISVYNFLIHKIHSRDFLSEMKKDENYFLQEDFYWKIQVKFICTIHNYEDVKHGGFAKPERLPARLQMKLRED